MKHKKSLNKKANKMKEKYIISKKDFYRLAKMKGKMKDEE